MNDENTATQPDDSNAHARALLMRVSIAALERATKLLSGDADYLDRAHDEENAARLIEAAAHGIETASDIGPLDPPDATKMAVAEAVATAIAKVPTKVNVYIGDELANPSWKTAPIDIPPPAYADHRHGR